MIVIYLLINVIVTDTDFTLLEYPVKIIHYRCQEMYCFFFVNWHHKNGQDGTHFDYLYQKIPEFMQPL